MYSSVGKEGFGSWKLTQTKVVLSQNVQGRKQNIQAQWVKTLLHKQEVTCSIDPLEPRKKELGRVDTRLSPVIPALKWMIQENPWVLLDGPVQSSLWVPDSVRNPASKTEVWLPLGLEATPLKCVCLFK